MVWCMTPQMMARICEIETQLKILSAGQAQILEQLQDALRDRVIEKDCLSEEDCELIDSKPTTRDQTRLLIKKLKDRGPIVIRNFLDILQEDIATSDISTTSEIPRGNLPSGNLFTDYDSAPSSMDPLKDSFTSQHSFSKEHLDHYDSIGSSKDNDDVQNTTASPRNRHQSEKFVPQENFVNEESDRCQSLSGYYGEGLPENAPENTLNQMFDRSMSKMSNSTLQAPKSGSGNESSIGEHTECKVSLTSDVRSSTSDKATSPEVDIPSHNFNVRQEENPNNTLDNQDHETDNHSHSNYRKRTDNSNSKTSQSPKERMKGKCNSENDDEVFVDVDADSDAHPDMTRKERRKIKNKRQKIKTRQNTPFSGGLFVTRSVSYQEKVDPKIGVKPLCVKKSKKSAKRELRRQRSRQECATSDELCDNSDESRGLKHPYNPM
ncbi:hypothetical protein MAR_028849, partial [Mya arenaria]